MLERSFGGSGLCDGLDGGWGWMRPRWYGDEGYRIAHIEFCGQGVVHNISIRSDPMDAKALYGMAFLQ